MPKALFMSTSLPPVADSQAIRNAALAAGLLRAGFRVRAIAPGPVPAIRDSVAFWPQEVCIIHTRQPAFDRVQSQLKRLPRAIGRLSRAAVSLGWGWVGVPDVRSDWESCARSTAEAVLRDWRADVIISSSGSASAHTAAVGLAACTRLPWVSDLGDPWSMNPLPPASLPHIRYLNSRLEARCLPRATLLTVTTEETALQYERLYPETRGRIVVVPCGYSDSLRSRKASPAEDNFSLAYIGTANRGSRDLRSIAAALGAAFLEAKKNGIFRAVGDIGSALSTGAVNERFRCEVSGWVDYEDSLELMRQSNVLVLVGNAGSAQVPAKTFNYIASGRPIFYVGQQSAALDPTARLLSGLPGIVMCSADYPSLRAAARKLVAGLGGITRAAEGRMDAASSRVRSWTEVGDYFARQVAALLLINR